MKRTKLRLFFRKVTNWLVWFSDWLWEDSEVMPLFTYLRLTRIFSAKLPVGMSLSQVDELNSDSRIDVSED